MNFHKIFLICFLCLNRNAVFGKKQFVESNRTRRQNPGFNYICAAPETCINAAGGIGIDPRIVTPGGTGPVCGPGEAPCYGIQGSGACGQRYVPNINTNPGIATEGAFPWQAYIRNQSGTVFTGSGVLIDNWHVLTAAHKVYDSRFSPGSIIVNMGVYNPSTSLSSPPSQRRTASQITIHESYQPDGTYRYNIAIIRLDAPIALGFQKNIGTACLPPQGASYAGRSCTVSGWGKSQFGNYNNDAPTNSQKQVDVPIVSLARCRAEMVSVLGNVDPYLDPNGGPLCAGGQANRDACTSDGGAPLVCNDYSTGGFTVVGLVNWGKQCGLANVYGVYVDIAKFRSWIDSRIGPMNG